MTRIVTSIKIEESLRDEAKKNNIKLGDTLEEALKVKLNKDQLLDDKRLELKNARRTVRNLEKEVKDLESKQLEVKEKYGNIKEREEKAERKLEKIYDRQG